MYSVNEIDLTMSKKNILSQIHVIKNDENTKHVIVSEGDLYDNGWRKVKILNTCV